MGQSYNEVWDVDLYEQDDLVIKDEFDEGRSQNGPICFTEAETEFPDRYVESYEIYHHTMTGGSREGVPDFIGFNKTAGGRMGRLPRLTAPQKRAFEAIRQKPRIAGMKGGLEVGQRTVVGFRALRDQPPASENAHGSSEQETPAHGKSLQKEHNSQGRAPYKEEHSE